MTTDMFDLAEPDGSRLALGAEARVRARIEAAANKRIASKRKRGIRAVARQHGLAARHHLKLARLRQQQTKPDNDPPDQAGDAA